MTSVGSRFSLAEGGTHLWLLAGAAWVFVDVALSVVTVTAIPDFSWDEGFVSTRTRCSVCATLISDWSIQKGTTYEILTGEKTIYNEAKKNTTQN